MRRIGKGCLKTPIHEPDEKANDGRANQAHYQSPKENLAVVFAIAPSHARQEIETIRFLMFLRGKHVVRFSQSPRRQNDRAAFCLWEFNAGTLYRDASSLAMLKQRQYRQSQGKFMKGRGRGHESHFNFKRPPNQKIRASSPRLLLFLDHELTPPYSGYG